MPEAACGSRQAHQHELKTQDLFHAFGQASQLVVDSVGFGIFLQPILHNFSNKWLCAHVSELLQAMQFRAVRPVVSSPPSREVETAEAISVRQKLIVLRENLKTRVTALVLSFDSCLMLWGDVSMCVASYIFFLPGHVCETPRSHDSYYFLSIDGSSYFIIYTCLYYSYTVSTVKL